MPNLSTMLKGHSCTVHTEYPLSPQNYSLNLEGEDVLIRMSLV